MSCIGANIKKIRQVHKLSQAEFASLFNLARPSVGAYEEGRSEPKIETLILISKRFGLSIDSLLNRELTANDLFHLDKFKKKMDRAHEKDTKDHIHPVKIIRASQLNEYLINLRNRDFIENLEESKIPLPPITGTYRFFENPSAEMYSGSGSIKPGDLLLMRRTSQLVEGRCYLLIGESSFLLRRLIKLAENKLTMAADAPAFEDQILDINNIIEKWELTGILSLRIEDPERTEKRLSELEKKIEELSKKLSPKST